MSKLEKVLDTISNFLIAAIVLLVTCDIGGRYLFNRPIQGTLELVEFIMVGVVFLGLSHSQAKGANIRVTLLVERTKGRTRLFLNLMGLFLGFCVLCLIVWRGGVAALEAWRGNYVTMGIQPLPEWPAKSLIPVGALIASVRIVLDIWSELRSFRKNRG